MPTTTMKRIAGELGVSITTVSKVLNNRDDIGHATRARVLAKVAELGYQPNAVARSLTLRRTHTLGIVIPDLMHSFFVEIVAGLEPVAQRARLRPAALQLERGSGARSARSSRCCASGRSTASSSRRRNASGNTDLLQQLDLARHRPRDDRPRRSPRRQVRPRASPTTSRSDGWRRRTCSTQGRRAIAHIGGTADRPRQAARRRASARR